MSRITWPVSSDVSPPAPVAASPWQAASVQAVGGGFVVNGAWAAVYRVAYERAQAALEPSRFQKMMEPCWN